MTLRIPDVSEFQKVINWAALGATNPAVAVRAHNGYRPDNYWAANLTGARGHCTWRMFYAYLPADVDPVQAAHAFQSTTGPLQPGEVACLDLEEGAGDQSGRRASWLNALQDPVEWTYSGLSFARAHLPGIGVQWLAAYGQAEPTDAHALWQYTSSQTFPGIASPCDASIYNGTLAQLITLTQGAEDMDAAQDTRLTNIENLLTRLSFGIDNGAPIPFSQRGEITARLRTIDAHTIAQPPTTDAIATATAAKVATLDAGAVAAAVVAQLAGVTAPTPEQIAAAVRAELVTNPLSLH